MDRFSKLRYKSGIPALGLALVLLVGVALESPASAFVPPRVDLFVIPGTVQAGDYVNVIITIWAGNVDSCTIKFVDFSSTWQCASSPSVPLPTREEWEGTKMVTLHVVGPGGTCDRSASVTITKNIPAPSPPAPTYTAWSMGYVQVFETPTDIEIFRQFRDEFLAGNKNGRLYADLLYENSEQALQVLLDNPDLMRRAKKLLEINQEGILEVLNGNEAVVKNPSEILAFLDKFTAKSPVTLKVLARMVKKDMVQKFKQGKSFIGFKAQ